MDELETRATQDDAPCEDYRDGEGLLVCGRCGTRKEAMLPGLLDRPPRVVRCRCKCEQQAEDERRAQAEERERSRRIERARTECFKIAPAYAPITFADDDRRTPEQSDICERWAATFDKADPAGLLLCGGVGTGKSFMSVCVANALLDAGYSVLHTDIAHIVAEMESSFEGRAKNLERILSYDLLCIEDLGAQRSTEYMMEHVFNVIDGRYKAGRPMVITTNFTLDQVSHPAPSSPWCRTFDRIIQCCYPVTFTGASRRRLAALDMRRAMRERLGIRGQEQG